MKHQCVLTSGLVISAIVNIGFLAGCGGGTALTGGGGNPVPTITAMSPTSAVAGSASGFTLTINGANFMTTSMVNFGGTMPTTTFVSSTQLTAAIPAAVIASAGTASVTVTNPTPGGGTSNPVNFTISGGNSLPTITTISPDSAVAGGAAFTLTVNGTNFVSASLVTFGGTTRTTTFVSSMQLAASIDAAAITTGGTAQVWVTNPAPGGGKSNPVNFSISGGPNPIPAINSLSPDVATVGGPAFTLTVYGSRIDSFVDSSVVRWNGSDRPTAFVTSNQLTAQVPASDIDAIGTAAVSVFTPAPGGGVSNTANFTIATGGVGPTSMTVAPDPAGKFGKFAYVTNSRTNNVSMYTIHSDGTLTPIAPGTIATGTTPSSVAVDPSGKFAYVTNSGLSQAGNVSVYTINADGKLTPNGAIPAGSYPRSIAIDPLGRFAYVANSGGCGGAGLGDLSMYTINSDGTLTLLAPGTIAAGVCPSAVAVDPSGKFAYAADTGDCDFLVGSISIYKINPAFAGTLSATATIDAGACPFSVAVALDPSGKFGGFVYVANSEYFGASSVLMYSIDSVSGVLTPLTPTGTIAAGTDSRSVAVHPSGKFAYVANFGSNDVSMYSIDTATGALQSIGSGTVAAGLGPMSIAIDPSGKFAYVANSTSNDVSIYGIDAATGALTLIATIST